MNVATDILVVLVACIGLWKGAVWLVESACRIAKRLGISELVIGLTVVAFGTSAPEFAVSITAALNGHANISVGNVVGSNIFNLGFILGGVALVRAISIPRILVRREGPLLIGTALLLLVFLYDLHLARWEGIVLLTVLVGYLGMLLYCRETPPTTPPPPSGDMQWYDALLLLVGIVTVVTSGHFLVASASTLARVMGISEWVIGVTIVAVGTSMPEVATSLVAVLRGRYGISVGNLIGSDLFNLLGVLGVAACIQPMSIDPHGYGSLLGLLGLMVLVVVMMRTGWRVSRTEGGILVLINLARWAADFTWG